MARDYPQSVMYGRVVNDLISTYVQLSVSTCSTKYFKSMSRAVHAMTRRNILSMLLIKYAVFLKQQTSPFHPRNIPPRKICIAITDIAVFIVYCLATNYNNLRMLQHVITKCILLNKLFGCSVRLLEKRDCTLRR